MKDYSGPFIGLSDMGVADFSPSSRPGEENLPRYALGGQQVAPDGLEPPVRVQLEALRELRVCQAGLERYVRASFASQERFTDSFKVLSWLSERKPRPEKLKSDDYWLRGEESLERIDALTDFLADLRLDEADFASWGASFDSAHETSMSLVRSMRDPMQEEDPRGVADKLEQAVRSMNQVSARMLRLCEREAERVIEEMKKGLTRIFDRIETERQLLDMVAQQQHHIEPSGFEEIKKPQDGINQTEQPHVQPRAGQNAAGASTRESQAQEGGVRAGLRREVSSF
jgi:hypothetical protein